MNNALMFGKASDNWSTPQETFDALNAEFHFVIDAAASPENRKCSLWLGPGSLFPDALDKDWAYLSMNGALWLNPPYSKCREFIAKASLERVNGCTTVCLVPSRTDTRWWHSYVWDVETNAPYRGVEVRFIKGRLKFGGATAGAPFPSVIIVFRGAK